MVPKLVMPAAMQPWTALSPMAWALDAFVQLFARTAAPGLVVTACVQLLAFALACCVLGSWLLQRR
jgi:ABC-2 type transport system permease protein